MTYWFTDPSLKALVPLASASAVKGLSSTFMVPRIIMGANALSEASGIGAGIGDMLAMTCAKKRAFMVTDKVAARYAEIAAGLMQSKGFTTQTWNGAEPEAPLETVLNCGNVMKAFEPDVIIAVGGGSVIDTAKAAWIVYERPDIRDLALISPLMPLGLRKKAVLVAIPTTSGTGSDCTAVSVVTDTKAKRKVPIVNAELLPDFSVLVPAFVLGMPPELTAGTGLDALAHAMDNVMSPTTNDFCDAMALRAIQMIFKYLPRAYHEGVDHEARYRMHQAASMAGIAFGNGGVAMTHSLGHSLGKLFSVHHGVAVGVFIPYAMQFYATVTDKYMDMCPFMGIRSRSKEAALAGMVKKVKGLMNELDIPTTIEGLGISSADLKKNMEKLTLYAFEDPSAFQSPRPATMAQCEKLFLYAYAGKDIDF